MQSINVIHVSVYRDLSIRITYSYVVDNMYTVDVAVCKYVGDNRSQEALRHILKKSDALALACKHYYQNTLTYARLFQTRT